MAQETPHYGHEPIEMRKVWGFSALEKPGDFYWQVGEVSTARDIVFALPTSVNGAHGRFRVNRLSVCRMGEHHPTAKGPVWGWTGDEEKPTLTPSIHCTDHWHGFMQNGKLVEA